MALKDLIPQPVPCVVARTLESFDDDDRATLSDWLQTKGCIVIERLLAQNGTPIGASSIARHQKGVCACTRGNQ